MDTFSQEINELSDIDSALLKRIVVSFLAGRVFVKTDDLSKKDIQKILHSLIYASDKDIDVLYHDNNEMKDFVGMYDRKNVSVIEAKRIQLAVTLGILAENSKMPNRLAHVSIRMLMSASEYVVKIASKIADPVKSVQILITHAQGEVVLNEFMKKKR